MKKIIFFFCFFYSFIFVNAQGTWTWMHGSNGNGATGNFGTQGVASPTNTPPALYEACEWTDLNGNFWLYGGVSTSALWKFDPTTNMWTWMKGPQGANQLGVYGVQGVSSPANYPGATSVGTLSWVDQQGNLWMMGGQGSNSTSILGFLSDLWKYNISTNEWTWMNGTNTMNHPGNYGTKGVAAPTNIPRARAETAAAWTDNNNNLWLYGGNNSNDLWKYDISTNMWTWMKGANTQGDPGSYGTLGVAALSNEPPARDVYAHWKDKNGNLWMMGGQRWALANDLWKYDVSSNMWTWVRGSSTPGTSVPNANLCSKSNADDPSNRWENRACWVDTCGNFWMFGGGTSTSTFTNDLWHYNVQNNVWTMVNANGPTSQGTILVPAPTNKPAARFGANPFTDNQGNLWVFGGWENFTVGQRNDLWKYVIDTSCAGGCGPPSTNVNANFTASNISGCANLTVNFTNTSSNSTSWNWTFGDGNSSTQQNPSNTYNTPGQYTVTLIASNGSQNDTTTQVNYVTVYANAVANFSSNKDTICLGASVNFTNNSTNSNASAWTFGDGNSSNVNSPSHNYGVVGTYTVTLIAQNVNGCHDTLSSQITVIPNFTFTQNANICTGQNYTLPDGTIVNTTGTYLDTLISINGCDSIITTNLIVSSILTSSQNPIICSGNNFTLPSGNIVSASGTYTDTVHSSGGCDSVITTNLTVNNNSTFSQTQSLCIGQNYTLPGGTIVNTSGVYFDTILNSKGCDSIITTTIIVNSNPTASATSTLDTIVQGQSTILSASGGVNYVWYPTTNITPTSGNIVTATPNQTTLYCVVATDTNGCLDTSCITIYVKELPCAEENNLQVPNAFSPNGDGVNDEFCLQGWTPCNENFIITIFNRWGEKVYESKDPNFCWDGKNNQNPFDAQVFVYYIKARFLNIDKTIIKKGNISLIR